MPADLSAMELVRAIHRIDRLWRCDRSDVDSDCIRVARTAVDRSGCDWIAANSGYADPGVQSSFDLQSLRLARAWMDATDHVVHRVYVGGDLRECRVRSDQRPA
jgi:hypothetical protein